MAIQISTPTPSQEASAACHLERQAEWRVVRIDGTRYVVLPSGHSNRTYFVRADGRACECPFYERTGRQCSHMLAVERLAMLEELAETPVPSLMSLRSIYPPCAAGCGQIIEGGNQFCDECSARRERAARLAAARASVLAEWTS